MIFCGLKNIILLASFGLSYSYIVNHVGSRAVRIFTSSRSHELTPLPAGLTLLKNSNPVGFRIATECLMSSAKFNGTCQRDEDYSSNLESVIKHAALGVHLMSKVSEKYDLQLAAYLSGTLVMASKVDFPTFVKLFEAISPMISLEHLPDQGLCRRDNVTSPREDRTSLISRYIQFASSFLTKYEQQSSAEGLTAVDLCLSQLRNALTTASTSGSVVSVVDGLNLVANFTGPSYSSLVSLGCRNSESRMTVEWSSLWCSHCNSTSNSSSSSEADLGNIGFTQTNVLKYSLIGLSRLLQEVARSVEEQTSALTSETPTTRRKLRVHKPNWSKQSALILAMVVRCSRLVYACEQGREAEYQQLARDTLMHWVPLSHELELSDKLPELAECSYFILYNQVYNSTVQWYRVFAPIADKLILSYVSSLNTALSSDPYLSTVFNSISVGCRIKQPLSIFEKMLRPGSTHADIHDIVGLRLIAEPGGNLASCDNAHAIAAGFETMNGNKYLNNQLQHLRRLLADVSDDWIEDRNAFKNYVLYPKSNGYQSLHMVMIHTPTGLRVEIQLRTTLMHYTAECGSASHGYYKTWMCRHAANRTSVDQQRAKWNTYMDLRRERRWKQHHRNNGMRASATKNCQPGKNQFRFDAG